MLTGCTGTMCSSTDLQAAHFGPDLASAVAGTSTSTSAAQHLQTRIPSRAGVLFTFPVSTKAVPWLGHCHNLIDVWCS